MSMHILTTNYDTHDPSKWAEVLLDHLVPTIPAVSPMGLVKIGEAKDKLRPHVIALITEVREHERQSYRSFTKDDNEKIAAMYRHYHGLEAPNGLHFHTLHKDVKGKVRSSAEWADVFVQKICAVASEIDGHIASNQMVDEVYRILENFLNSVQMCERSHHVTNNRLHIVGE